MILILGQARTGTSLTGGILSKLGISMGQLFDAPDEWNPQGNFVDADLSRLNHYLYRGERLIGGAYASADDPMWRTWREMILSRQAIKDHALLPLLDQFMSVINPADLKVIHTTRSIAESTDSLTARRPDHNRTASIQFQADCQTLIESFLEKYQPATLILEFNDAFRDPAAYVSQIARFVGVPCNQQAIDSITPQLKRF